MVQDQTRQTLHFSLLELGCGSESLDRMTDNLQHELQRVPYRVVIIKNGYGVFDLAWQAEEHREWPEIIARELDEIRAGKANRDALGPVTGLAQTMVETSICGLGMVASNPISMLI